MQALKHAEEAKQRANEKVIDVAVEETTPTAALSLTEPELALSELTNFEEELAAQFPVLEEEVNDTLVSSINSEENSSSINWDELDTRLAFLEENEISSQATQVNTEASPTALAAPTVSIESPFVAPAMPLFPALEELDNNRILAASEVANKTQDTHLEENKPSFKKTDLGSITSENEQQKTTVSAPSSELHWDNDLFDNPAPLESAPSLNFESNASPSQVPNLDFGGLFAEPPTAQKAQNVFAATEQPQKTVLKKQAQAANYRLYSLVLLLLVTASIVFYVLNHSKMIETWLEKQGFIAASSLFPPPDKIAVVAPEPVATQTPPATHFIPTPPASSATVAAPPAVTVTNSTENAKAVTTTTWTDLSSAVRSALEHKLPQAETVVAHTAPTEVTSAPPKTNEVAATNTPLKQNTATTPTEELAPSAVNAKKTPVANLSLQANSPVMNETATTPAPAAKIPANKNPAKTPTKPNNQEQRLFEQLQIAYRAFQRGDELAAYQNYQSVLQQLPSNRDALLGLAAIATQRGQVQQAFQYYQKILAIYPEDSVAMTALVGLTGQQSPERAEAQLQSLLKTTPSAYVYYALGTLYTRQNRWQQAQQAFFDAWRLDKTQADYAYNLAVSLEYLKQSSAALPYYQQALQLLQQNPNNRARFNPQQVQQRIQQLTH